MPRRGLVTVLLCLLAQAGLAADAVRGGELYRGQLPLTGVDGRPARHCQECHRPSGIGTFEGGLAVPPITAPSLFAPYDRDVAHFFRPSAKYRVRPAYTDADIATLLRSGVTPDGVVLHAAMPRYSIDARDAADLTQFLHQLSSAAPPGLDARSVHMATITTPEADAARGAAMLATLRRFVALKNGQSRNEVRRAEVSSRTGEMATDRKYRIWVLHHWALEGPAETWAAQLDAWQTQQPVYAVVGGMGGVQWQPVNAFCERRRVPCLLPLVEAAAPGGQNFYTVHFHAGLAADADKAAQRLLAQGTRTFGFAAPQADTAARRLVADRLRSAGLQLAPGSAGPTHALLSLLAPEAQSSWLQADRPAAKVVWLAGTHALGPAELERVLPLMPGGLVVTPMRTGADLERQLRRARTWLKSNGLQQVPVDVGASTLLAAGVLGEGLTHADFSFNQQYMLELLEHGLENMLPVSPFPRLALGPGQRVASKGSWIGEVQDGKARWQWEAEN